MDTNEDRNSLFDDQPEKEEDNSSLFPDDMDKDDNLFAENDKDDPVEETDNDPDGWKVLIVDDEEDIHSVTRIALRGFNYRGRGIQLLSTFSAEESKKVLKEHPDIAFILLDVVMETNHAGLDLVRYIRDELKNPFVQIILRTGHPGYAPERDVIVNYQINDYKAKTELTALKLFTTVFAGIRTYEFIMELEEYKQFLEQKVEERTVELEEKNKTITESIEYASRIQAAILPPENHLKELLPESFILYQPKDIVSGDFYWVNEQYGKLLVAVSDCTGHGVPGAFMSVLGITLLEEISNLNPDFNADEILNMLAVRVTLALKQTGQVTDTQEGMDISLCIIDKKKQLIQFAGSYHSLITVSQQLREHEADKVPACLGGKADRRFSCNEIAYTPGEMIYMYTDGYIDQFGGQDNKKFTIGRFRELLADIYEKNPQEQKETLEKALRKWQGEEEQLDDVTVMGIRL